MASYQLLTSLGAKNTIYFVVLKSSLERLDETDLEKQCLFDVRTIINTLYDLEVVDKTLYKIKYHLIHNDTKQQRIS